MPRSHQKKRRPAKFCVNRNHSRLYVDFAWDLLTQTIRNAFGVNAPFNPICVLQ